MARRKILIPMSWSELLPFKPFKAFCARINATPPPATIPSSTAARVA